MNYKLRLSNLKHDLFFEQKKLDDQMEVVKSIKLKIKRIEKQIYEKDQLKLFDS